MIVRVLHSQLTRMGCLDLQKVWLDSKEVLVRKLIRYIIVLQTSSQVISSSSQLAEFFTAKNLVKRVKLK